ncbi:holin family protein [Clostridium sp.]|uniref:phage holin family protein n=1 Tax=Clostridium sp. TaxID=1506 RepID=UPI001A43FA1A|nr:phage holin family protein [Clostridium sp.]MBK5243050.1 phage holin family protein [Clostridium sp.]
MDTREVFNTVIAFVCSVLAYLFGAWDNSIQVLILFIALDYITGVWGACVLKRVSSIIGINGILKKATILIVLIMAVLLDRLINNGTWAFRTLVCYFYIANEGISILENAVIIGIPVPDKLVDILKNLKNKEEN